VILEIAAPLPVHKTFDYTLPFSEDKIHPEDLLGRRVKISFGPRTLAGVIVKTKETSNADITKLKPVMELLDEEPILSPSMIRLGEWISQQYLCTLGEALFALMPPGKSNTKSFKNGESFYPILDNPSLIPESNNELTPDQISASQKIHNAIYEHKDKTFLLYGVAAAGKTEVYMSAIKDVLTQHKNILVLSPEIGLSFQMVNTLRARFGDDHVLHYNSNAPLKQRIQDWWRIKRGEVPIVVGARSAVLVPLPLIGLVVVDEEHDVFYKEERKPRFHVRDVAKQRVKEEKGIVLFGSATPSLEMYQSTVEKKAELIELKERVVRASKPVVRLVDTREEKYKGVLSRSLQ